MYMEKEMAVHSTIVACKIPWSKDSGGLQSMGCRVGHDLAAKQQQLYVYVYIYTNIYMESRKMVLMNLFEGQK